MLTRIVIGISLLIAVTACSATAEPAVAAIESATAEPAVPAIEIDAAALCGHFQANEVAANIKFLNKTVIVSGQVYDISGTEYRASVMLGGSGNCGVVCSFEEEHWPELAQLAISQEVSLKGQVTGHGFSVALDGCTIHKTM